MSAVEISQKLNIVPSTANESTTSGRKIIDRQGLKLFNELKKCPDKQLAQYAEKSIIAIDKESKEAFLGIINLRLKSLGKESQIKRIKKVIKKVEKA